VPDAVFGRTIGNPDVADIRAFPDDDVQYLLIIGYPAFPVFPSQAADSMLQPNKRRAPLFEP